MIRQILDKDWDSLKEYEVGFYYSDSNSIVITGFQYFDIVKRIIFLRNIPIREIGGNIHFNLTTNYNIEMFIKDTKYELSDYIGGEE